MWTGGGFLAFAPRLLRGCGNSTLLVMTKKSSQPSGMEVPHTRPRRHALLHSHAYQRTLFRAPSLGFYPWGSLPTHIPLRKNGLCQISTRHWLNPMKLRTMHMQVAYRDGTWYGLRQKSPNQHPKPPLIS